MRATYAGTCPPAGRAHCDRPWPRRGRGLAWLDRERSQHAWSTIACNSSTCGGVNSRELSPDHKPVQPCRELRGIIRHLAIEDLRLLEQQQRNVGEVLVAGGLLGLRQYPQQGVAHIELQ